MMSGLLSGILSRSGRTGRYLGSPRLAIEGFDFSFWISSSFLRLDSLNGLIAADIRGVLRILIVACCLLLIAGVMLYGFLSNLHVEIIMFQIPSCC